MAKLADLAEVIRSKNAGAFQITLDVMFPDAATFERVQASGVLCSKLIADLYRVPIDSVQLTVYPPANAIKATIPRRIPSGDIGDSDIYGAQQHAPLLSVEIPD